MKADQILAGSVCLFMTACAASAQDGQNYNQSTDWGNINIAEKDGYYTVSLENSAISVQYDMHQRHAKRENQEIYIVSFVIKKSGEDLGDWLDAAAGRYLLRKAAIVYDGSDRKTVRMEWETKREGRMCIEEVSIFPNSPVMRIDYFTTCVNIVDIGFKGKFGTYTVYGAEEWFALRKTVTDPELTNHENEHHRLVYELYPRYPNPFIDTPDWKGLAPTPLDYNGWMIMGVYNEESGIGYGRVVPFEEISYMKFLGEHGFEFFPFWRNTPSPRRPFTTYLLPVTKGEEELISLGKAITILNGNSQANWKYRLPVEVDTGEYERYDKPVHIHINFAEQLKRLGITKAFSRNSIRVVEVDWSGKPLDNAVAYQFDEAPDYDAETNASGTLVFILKGTTPANTRRLFHVYFNDTGGFSEAPSFPAQVLITDVGEYEGDESFKIATQNATYYYHKHGSGFASMIDSDGNDWISFHPTTRREDGPRGAYRGIPNVAPADFHPGRGESKLPSKIVSQGPLRAKILSETKDGKWGCTWDIYPSCATMTLFKKGEEPYWILYEGTPGGEFDLDDYWVHSSGGRLSVAEYYMPKNQWQGKLPSPKWVYFGDGNMNRVLYLILHERHDVEDQFWHFGEGGMTVFGFGRGPTRENWQQLTAVPAHLTIGFVESGDFETASKVINSAYQKLDLFVGSPETPGKEDWGSVNVVNEGNREAYLENSKIRITYARQGVPGEKVTDRIVEFIVKEANYLVSDSLDGRHTAGESKAFYRLTDVRVEHDGAERKTVRLDLGNGSRAEHLSIFKDLPVVKIEYSGGGHNLDYRIKGGNLEIYGADEWQRQNGWSEKYPKLRDELTENGSYYRSDWGDPGPLTYEGYMIMGVYSEENGIGLGLILPAERVRWLKLLGTSGFERMANGPHTAYLYAVTGGGEAILSDGKRYVDRITADDL